MESMKIMCLCVVQEVASPQPTLFAFLDLLSSSIYSCLDLAYCSIVSPKYFQNCCLIFHINSCISSLVRKVRL